MKIWITLSSVERLPDIHWFLPRSPSA